MTYDAWVSMGVNMSGAVCFFSLCVCVHTCSVWVG